MTYKILSLGPWTTEEDDKVTEFVRVYGVKSWSFIAKQLQGRLGKQCRERWYNHLNPGDLQKAQHLFTGPYKIVVNKMEPVL